MPKLDEKGLVQFLVILILTAGTIAGVYLVTFGPLKLFPRAVSAPITPPTNSQGPYQFILSNLTTTITCQRRDSNCKYTTNLTVKNKLDESLFKNTLYKSDRLNRIVFGALNTPDAQVVIAQEVGARQMVLGSAPLTFIPPNETGEYFATLYLDGQRCNQQTTPPDCIFYGASSIDFKATVNNSTVTIQVTNHSSSDFISPAPTISPSPSPSTTPSPTPSPTASTNLKPDLTIEKVEAVGTPQPGSNADFNIVVKNIGQAVASHPNSILVNVVIRKPNEIVLGSCIWAFNNLTAGAKTQATRIKDCPAYNITGQHKVIVEVDPHTEGILGLDRVAESNETNNIQEILVNIPVATASPAGGPISAPIGGPAPKVVTQFRFAEDPTSLQQAVWQNYISGMVVSHTFSNSSTGLKFIFIQFRDDQGGVVKINGQDYISSSIELVETSVSAPITLTPTPSPTLAPTPAPTIGPTPIPVTPRDGGGEGGGSRPTPVPQRIITQMRFAENPNDVERMSWQPYSPGMVISHNFSDSSPRLKFIFIQFRDNNSQIVKINRQDYISSSIELIQEETPVPTSIPQAVQPVQPAQQPVENNGADCPISHPQNYDIGTLKRLCYPSQMIRFDIKYLNNFDNQTLIDIGRATGNLGSFLANFTGERLLGLPPFAGAAFSLEILRELPDWRIQQLPGYIQDQIYNR